MGMKGIALMACLVVVIVGMVAVNWLPIYPPGPETEWRDSPTLCEQVRKYEPNQPLREYICLSPSEREHLKEQQKGKEPKGIEL